MKKEYLFTSESVSEGHPDKVADRISDAVLDAYIAHDKNARSACETIISKDLLVISGEFRTNDEFAPDFQKIAFNSIREIGYGDGPFGFDFEKCRFVPSIKPQSQDIAAGVELGNNIGAGDQGLMFGYATNETYEYMPLPLSLAHKLMQRQAELRKSKKAEWLGPDAKSQVTVKYADGRPFCVDTVVLSTQHIAGLSRESIYDFVCEEIIYNVIPAELRQKDFKVHINPTGQFIDGGPNADTGLTGRKIIVDTYGGACPHGGGAFSGKDPTKVDRSAAYMARYAAKNIVANGYADKCTLQIAYAIGVPEPVSLMVDTHGTGKVPDSEIEAIVIKNFDFTPAGVIDTLKLRRPFYQKTAAYGHFGRNEPEFEWERIIKL